MQIFIDPKFYKNVPKNKINILQKKITKFKAELENNKDITTLLSKGFFCMKIKAIKNRYKFRINNGDRVVFCYDNMRNIHLLRYCCHDDQILEAARISLKYHIFENTIDPEPRYESYHDEEFDSPHKSSEGVYYMLFIDSDDDEIMDIEILQEEYHEDDFDQTLDDFVQQNFYDKYRQRIYARIRKLFSSIKF